MSKTPHYLVAPVALNEYRRLPVDNILQAPLFAQFTPTEEEVFVPVTLASDPVQGTWRVRWEFGILGEVAKDLREEYPEMVRITSSGFLPETIAGIRIEDNQLRVDVLLPPPELAVPRNNVTDETWILPPGDSFEVDTTTGEFDESELQVLSPGQWLLILTEMGDQLIAVLDGRVLGAVQGDAGARLLSFVHLVNDDDPGSPVAGRGYFQDSVVRIDASQPRGDSEHVAPLQTPDTRPRTASRVNQLEDGTVMVTVAHVLATDPEDEAHPHEGARVVVSPHEDVPPAEAPAPEPEVEQLPEVTQVAEAEIPVDEEQPPVELAPSPYLSHSEQLNQWRDQQSRSAGPRHYREDAEE
ncbi:hypothetical protein [Corynebacterium lubricantis]|uniref:hypothetical protein n=1 Tax=Corynebacterium lubricantis TaxID=541095 RepID=UPI000379D9E9|nr:hypothetical protein [Corynebacterium lubricantis]